MFWLPKCTNTRTHPAWVEPEVYFRIVHATRNGHNGAPVASYHEQTVEIALGPKGSFENGNIGAFTRRALPNQLTNAVPPGRGSPNPPREPKTPRVLQLLRKAIEWEVLLKSGKVASQADIARQEGVSRARVTQVLGLPRLAPEIQEKILTSPGTLCRGPVTERRLRTIGTITEQRDQVREFPRFLLK